MIHNRAEYCKLAFAIYLMTSVPYHTKSNDWIVNYKMKC
jgi:hypothetical protein